VSDGAPHLVQTTVGGVRWQLVPECRDLLFDADGLRLAEWLRSGAARVVKHGPHRTVYRVDLPGLSFYLKHCRVYSFRAWLRECVRPAKARGEFDRARAVADRGVPTVTPLAFGRRTSWGPGDSFLITRALDGTEPLNAFLETTLPTFEPRRQARLRRRIALELGSFVARMHAAAIVHHDLHPGNLLVRLEADDRPSLYLIDLHAVQLGRSLGWRARRANLVILNRWFMLRASRSDRLRFWQAYCRSDHPVIPSSRDPVMQQDLARDLERRTWVSNLRFWQHRDRRCLASNRYYCRVRSAVAAGYAVRDLDLKVLTELLADPDAPFRRAGVVLLKDSRSSTVAELDVRVGGVVRRAVYKRFRVTSGVDPWAALVRRSPVLRSWIMGHGLRERCLPTARPLAAFQRRRAGLAYEGYLLTEKIPDAVDLHAFVAGLAKLPPVERQASLRRRIEQVARVVCDLHRRQLSHRDLKATNVLLTRDPDAVWLIDLVGLARCRKLSRSRRVKDLARLHASFHEHAAVTRTDKLRFLRIYLQWGLFGRSGWKGWWHEIGRATRAKVERNARRGRVLR
jgi:tRNA A-37 threonylcarbamoyl transferase component Bud32